MKRLLIAAVAVSLSTACATITHVFIVQPRDGGAVGQGEARERGREVTVFMDGQIYTGKYLIDSGKTVTASSSGTANAYDRGGTAAITGSATTSVYVPGSGNGSLLATSPSGDALRCEFQYERGGGFGVCRNNAGREFDMLIKN